MDLQALITQAVSGTVSQQISKATGVDETKVQSVIDSGLPVIIGQMARNTSTSDGAVQLDAALAKDHAGGSLLGDLAGLFTGGSSNIDGAKILTHVLSGNQTTANEQISQKTGVDAATVAKILSFVAPIIMAYLSKQKQSSDLDAGGIGDLLKSQTSSGGSPLMDIATAFFDKNKDGSIVDDLLGGFFKQR